MHVRLDYEDRLAEVVLCSPPVNALTLALLSQFERAVASIPDGARALVLRSEVPRVFMAGGDIAHMVGLGADDLRSYVARLQEAFTALESFPYPVVVGIDGHALGGGVEVALCCDIRIVSESASLGVPEVTLGIFPGAGGTQRLGRAVGQAAAMDLLLTGRRITGAEAHRLGFASRLVAEGEAGPLARSVGRELAHGASEALAATKRLALAAYDIDLRTGLEREREEWHLVRQSANAQEGLSAFLEKRPAVFG